MCACWAQNETWRDQETNFKDRVPVKKIFKNKEQFIRQLFNMAKIEDSPRRLQRAIWEMITNHRAWRLIWAKENIPRWSGREPAF